MTKVAEHASTTAAVAVRADPGDPGTPSRALREDGALVRPRFFVGQLLTAEDLAAEQDYVRARLDRRNRALCGAGIVDGLEVTLDADASDAAHVIVAPGLAFDAFGREIFVGRCTRAALQDADGELLVCLSYFERAFAPAATADPNDDANAQATRIVETFAISLEASPPDGTLPIARLRRLHGRWRVDPRFGALRIRR